MTAPPVARLAGLAPAPPEPPVGEATLAALQGRLTRVRGRAPAKSNDVARPPRITLQKRSEYTRVVKSFFTSMLFSMLGPRRMIAPESEK